MAKKKPLCGDFGGTNRFDEPCGRPAGWRTEHSGTGRCTFHPDGIESKAPPVIPNRYSVKKRKGERPKSPGAGAGKKKMGRPSDYDESYAPYAYRLCLMGARDVDLARMFEVDVRTIARWKEDHEDFRQAVLDGREYADGNVAVAMYEAALGFQHDEEKVFQYKGDIITHEVTKQYPPNVAAGQLWLFNRQPQFWKDQRRMQLSGSINVEVSSLTDDELMRRIADRRAMVDNLFTGGGAGLPALMQGDEDEPN